MRGVFRHELRMKAATAHCTVTWTKSDKRNGQIMQHVLTSASPGPEGNKTDRTCAMHEFRMFDELCLAHNSDVVLFHFAMNQYVFFRCMMTMTYKLEFSLTKSRRTKRPPVAMCAGDVFVTYAAPTLLKAVCLSLQWTFMSYILKGLYVC